VQTSLSRPFDLVVLDLDGTIQDLYHHKPISDAVTRAIAAVQAAGIAVTIATGRTLDYVRANLPHLGVTTPVVTTQGAVIGDPLTGKILYEASIPLALAREAAAWIDARLYVTALYFLDDEGHILIYQNRAGPEPDFYDYVFGLPRRMQARFADLLVGEVAHSPLKFIIVEDGAAERVELVGELRTRFRPALTITRTHPRLVEGTAQGIDKGAGVVRLCAMLGIDPARVLAIGDSDNDIPILKAVGCAVAMGNASPGVMAVADWVAPPVEEDGAAAALRELVLAPLEAQRGR
jgi:Cof subfamily protein (haloacid dehalogenase superfamily)